MTNWEVALLGIIQGISEFLPISSSGHLEIAKVLMGNTLVQKESLLLTIVLHGATALSTLFVFRKDIGELIRDLFLKQSMESWRFVLFIVISMVPAAVVGLFFESTIAALFSGNLIVVGSLLLCTGVLLYFANRTPAESQPLSTRHAWWIGLAQAIAILPGLSRSGATIGTALLLRVERPAAARFSFLMVIPLIFGSMAKSLLEFEATEMSIAPLQLGIGFLTAFIAGVLACKWMIALVNKSQLVYFSLYCAAAGIFTLVYGSF